MRIPAQGGIGPPEEPTVESLLQEAFDLAESAGNEMLAYMIALALEEALSLRPPPSAGNA